MSRPISSSLRFARPPRLHWFGLLLAWLVLFTMAPSVRAQIHTANPFAGASWYLNPDYARFVDTSIAAETDATIAQQMRTVKTYPTAVWLDTMAAIAGTSTRQGLTAHLNSALAQQQGSTPVVVKLVIYDLPGRDCAALASNGEISILANPPKQPLSGLDTYKTHYIDPIITILSNPAYASLRIVAIVEPDSLPNLVTNPNYLTCPQALQSGVYIQGIQYAITRLHTLANVYQYLDIGHSGWLGWPNNMTPAISTYSQLVGATPAGFNTIDGFITNVANTLPTREPYMNSSMTVGGQPLISATFYQYNPYIEEASYAQAIYQNFVNAGFPARIGLLIDTSRNGWGGAARPSGPSTSTDLNTFVVATKIDRRAHRGLWCNPMGAGIGTPPQANPAGFFPQLQAFVWIKPPGESDGTYLASQSPNPDPNCDPSKNNALAGKTPTGAYPNSPPAGSFFPVQFHDLVANAFPPIPTSTSPTFTMTAAPTSVAVNRGAGTSSTLTLARVNGFTATVALAVTGLPSGVTASFAPASTPGSSSVLTLNASTTAALGAATLTVSATGGSITRTLPLMLTVAPVATPDFSVAASPSTLSFASGASATSTLSLTRANGFASAVSFSASGLPAGVTASFSPASTSTTGASSVLTLTASATATTGAETVTVSATGGGVTHTVPLAVNVTSSGGTGGAVTASTVIASASNYFNDQQVRLVSTGPISGLSVGIVIQRTTGLGFGGQYNTIGGSIAQTNTVTASTISYNFTQAAGQTQGAGTYSFAAQTSGNGTAHPMTGDTYTVTYASAGQTFTLIGHF